MSNTIPANFLAPKATPLDYPMPYPTGAWQPNVAVPQITMPQQNISQIQQIGEDLYQVKGMDGAKRFPTKPNSRYALFDSDNDVLYIKVTDQNNYPISLQRYVFIAEDEPEPEVPQYVTMNEFTKFKEELLDGIKHLRTESCTTANTGLSAKQSDK